MNIKKDIRTTTHEELLLFCTNNNLPKFRASQISEWLWKKRAVNFDEMTSLSLQVRKLLELEFSINAIKIHKAERSTDGTIKYSLKFFRIQTIQTVASVEIPI